MFILNPYGKKKFKTLLTAYYPFDSYQTIGGVRTFLDSISPACDLSVNGTSTIDVYPAVINDGAFCPASTNTVLRNEASVNTDKFSFTNGVSDLPYSISMHVYITNSGNASQANIFSKDLNGSSGSSTNSEWGIIYNRTANTIVFIKYSEGAFANNKRHSIPCPSLNAWHHLVITDDAAGNVKIYINGVFQTITTSNVGTGFVKYASTPDSRVSLFNLGGILSASYWLQGGVDDLGVFVGYVLTQQDIDWIYNGGNPRPLL